MDTKGPEFIADTNRLVNIKLETANVIVHVLNNMHEVEQMKKMGLGLGGNTENVVVFDNTGILSVPRFEDELIRHKILDVIGDLYLLGPIKAHVVAVKTGHAFNAELARQIENYRSKGEK